MPTTRRLDNSLVVPSEIVGNLTATTSTIGNLTVTGTTTTIANSSVQFSNVTVTGTLGAGTVNATTSTIGNLTVTGTFVNANAATQVSSLSVTGNASVGGNVVVGGDGIFTGNVRIGNSGTYALWSNGTIVASGVTVAQSGNTTTLGATGISTSGLLSTGTMSVTGNATVTGNVSATDVSATGNLAVTKNVVVTGNVSATDVNATGNLAVTKFATVTGGINLPGNAAVAYGNVASNAAVVLTTASFANVLLYANTSDTLANVTATGNLILSNNTANQVQSVNYVVPGLAPGVAFSANVGFSFATAGTSGGGDAFCIQMFPSDVGTGPLCLNTNGYVGSGTNATGFGYTFAYIMGNPNGKISFEYAVNNTVYYLGPTYVTNLSANTVYNFFVGFDGVQTWTYKVSNTTATVTSGTYVDTQALYNMAQATYPNVIRIRSNSNVGVSLITANAVVLTANVGSQFGNVSTAGGAFAVTNASGAQMMKINSAYPYTTTLGVLNANAAMITGPFGAFGATYLGNTLTVAGALTASGTTTLASVTATSASVSTSANQTAATITNTYASTTANVLTLATTTAAGAGFNMLMATANGVKQFRVAGNGATYANGPYSGAGADYAEYFEWADGNPGAEDRRGLTVTLTDDKIRLATVSDAPNDIIGAVSAVPTVLGDSAWSRWQGMYVLDAFGCSTTELNPTYDPAAEYIPRSERKEWAPIGLMGKLRVLNGRPVGSSWIRMKTDITPGIDVWLVR